MHYLTPDPQSPHTLILKQGQRPTIKEDEILIHVQASGINRADLLQIAGHYPPPKGVSDILGLEASGIVAAVPDNCRFKVGDHVIALLAGGGYGEYVAVNAGSVMPLPKQLTFIEGAAIAEAFITSYQALFSIGGLMTRSNKRQPRVLIHAGASGVGSAAIQLALLVGAKVFCTVGSVDKATAVKALGEVYVINYKESCFEQSVMAQTRGMGVDIIIDFIGGDYLKRNLACCALDATIVSLAMLSGRFSAEFDFAKLLQRRITLTGSTLRNRSNTYKSGLVSEFERDFLPLFVSGVLKPIIDSTYKYEDVNHALAHIAANKNIGKLILHRDLATE